MLEEALSSTTFSPAEASLALLTFVRFELPAGGNAAEARFLRLFSLLCERLFGLLDPKDFRHIPGGWLSRQIRWEIPVAPSTTKHPPHRPNIPGAIKPKPPYNADPVVQLLAGTPAPSSQDQLPTLIEAISAETEHRPGVHFSFPFAALPKPTQEAMLSLLRSAFGGAVPVDSSDAAPPRPNSEYIISTLLRFPPTDQKELIIDLQKKASKKQEKQRPLQLSPRAIPSPAMIPSHFPAGKETNEASDLVPNVILTMFEYYMFLFVRYPLATPMTKQPQPQGITNVSLHSSRYRKTESYGEGVYIHLFKGYLCNFLPHMRRGASSKIESKLSRESELFLRIIIEFWLDGEHIYPTTHKAAKVILERQRRSGGAFNHTLNFDSSCELVQMKYVPPRSMVRKCIRNLVNHLVSDPIIPFAVTSGQNSQSTRSRPTSSSPSPSTAASPQKWCLSPPMTVIQQSFYNYVRTTLCNAPIHVSDSPFYTALNAWLIWLEPWNVEMRKAKPTVSDFTPAKATSLLSNMSTGSHVQQRSDPAPIVTIPKPTYKSKYTVQWEPYIAANLHLYTVPFAIFLRRSRELDFSSKEFRTSIKYVQRVFRVFSPSIVDSINQLLEVRPSLTAHRLSNLVLTHEKLLGDFSPSLFSGDLNLSSCRQDMCNLLEEIYMSHKKTTRELDLLDRLAAPLEKFFGKGASAEEIAINGIVEKGRVIVQLPLDYEVVPKGKGQSIVQESDGTHKPDRQNGQLLSDQGREQLVSGTVKCSPADIGFIGDTMTSRPKSYEIPILVSWTVRLSNWLNWKLGLIESIKCDASWKTSRNLQQLLAENEDTRKQWFRINLRFLADYRNILFFSLVAWFYILFSTHFGG